ncbi:hypothetical protein F2Q68_00014707 [Brassica cretica]|uniref:Uncharacterized protein n=1 Tax=Brassica cretica TaxID=69181 RepID=A0A8S9HMS3_BRACR|nr:hypothetical protein F2Q68_00014707 [Brassica cretica]
MWNLGSWFIMGFLFGGIPWYLGAVIILFTSVDHREKAGYVACSVADFRDTNLNGAMEQMYTEMASIKSQVLLHPDHQDNHCPSQFVQEREHEAVSQQQDQVPFGKKEGQTPTRKLKTTYKAS